MSRGKFKVLHGDCLQIIPQAVERWGRPKFIFSDPPFNIGQAYSGYHDVMEETAFDLWTREWIKVCWNALASDGILALHGPDRLAELYLMAAHFFDMNRIAWVNWHYRFGQCNKGNWINGREHCLIFAKGRKWTWNPDDVLVDSDRATVYDDPRTKTTATPGKRVPFSVWGEDIDDGPGWGVPIGEETARPIPGHDGYFATYDGYIISRRRDESKVLRATTNSDGYLNVKVRNPDGVFVKKGVHRLVCLAFYGSPQPGLQARHLDGVRTNNCAGNLRWGTPKKNCEDRSLHGNWVPLSGEDHPGAKLTEAQVDAIRQLAVGGEAYDVISSKFGISKSQISRIRTGKRWGPSSVIGVREPFLGRIQGNNKERQPEAPNQLPEKYLERLLRAYTNPGDLVLDPFCGSGTTATVAVALGRNALTIDVSERNVEIARKRIRKGAVRL